MRGAPDDYDRDYVVVPLGQQRWLDQQQRHSHIEDIGDRWPDTLETHAPLK